MPARNASAISDVKVAMGGESIEAVKHAVLNALQGDATDAQIGKAVRIAVLRATVIKKK